MKLALAWTFISNGLINKNVLDILLIITIYFLKNPGVFYTRGCGCCSTNSLFHAYYNIFVPSIVPSHVRLPYKQLCKELQIFK